MPVSRLVALSVLIAATAAPALKPAVATAQPTSVAPGVADKTLQAMVDSPARPSADRLRDKYRHPYASLVFWGLKPGMTVMDLQPGGGYWTEILAPYAAQTGGVYIAGVADVSDPSVSAGARESRVNFEAKHSDRARYGMIRYVGFGSHSGPLAPAGSVDLILTSREIHNWIGGGYFDKAMAQCFAALKPGGVLAVEEHRADPKPQVADASNGYVAVSTVVDAARKAGFQLQAASEVNANPKDTKDHPFGVWTLPPTRQSAPDGRPADPTFNRAKYDAIGESDRMTLRFIKP